MQNKSSHSGDRKAAKARTWAHSRKAISSLFWEAAARDWLLAKVVPICRCTEEKIVYSSPWISQRLNQRAVTLKPQGRVSSLAQERDLLGPRTCRQEVGDLNITKEQTFFVKTGTAVIDDMLEKEVWVS